MPADEIALLHAQLERERAARVAAEQRLEELTEDRFLLQALMNFGADHVYFKDRDSRIVRVSKAMAATFGLASPEAAVGKRDVDFFTESHALQARADELAVMQSGQPITIEEVETWRDRPATWVSTTKAPLRDDEGKIVGTFGISRNISERKKIEQALIESEARFRDFFDQNSSVLLLIDPASEKIIAANAAAVDYYGYSQQQLLAMSISEINVMPPDHLFDEGQRVLREESDFILFDHRLASGEIRHVEVHLTPIESEGRLLLFAIVHDVTDRQRAEAKLRLAATVFTHAREGILITAPDATIIDVNEAFTVITGYSRDDVLGRKPSLLGSGRHGKDFFAALWRDLIEKGQWHGELWNRRKSGEVYAEMLTISTVTDVHGETQQYVALFSDITGFKEHERALERGAHFDALTGLPNRVLLADRMQLAMAHALRRNQRLAVAYLDLDGFKEVNDRYGHEVGDRLLVAVATRMKDALRDEDTLARIGGDEFIVLLSDLDDRAIVSGATFDRLLRAAATPFSVGELELQISASLGVTHFPQAEEVGAERLLVQADQAMYQAKLAGKNRYAFFGDEALNSV